ncbi:hypothetical protein [Candidatus Thiosymbion oneisti]|uniref:hypothetical protein n=1 Tax=Candidatus Thiosymbion oneisti TaxID=589554 RepID=UPI00105C7284|nr:hypothetical protein [Candidatus Thiosymbion oneisti]
MKTTPLIFFAAVVLAGCSSTGNDYCNYGNRDCTNVIDGDPVNLVRQKLTVRRHTKTDLDNKCVDCILADATEILQTKDGADDVACPVRLVRKGDVTEFNTGSGSIDSQADFDTIMRLPGDVKLVDEINWCGRYVVAYGCAQQNKSLAVVPISSDKAGILWAHEYGHVKGRGHRNADSALMHKWLSARNKKINRAECSALRK